MNQLTDNFGRIHDYLRVSITDRCNLRCVYCMGSEDAKTYASHWKLLHYKEILEVVRCAAELGVTKIRLTGGEPLVHPDIIEITKQIRNMPGIEDLSLTTNGVLLDEFAEKLKAAGLNRVNISLDSLNPARYRKITRDGELEKVLQGLDAALSHGLEPVKINVVLMRNCNDVEIPDFISLALNRKLIVRFIEYMPIDHHDENYLQSFVPASLVKKTAEAASVKLVPISHPLGAGPADYFSISKNGKKGTIGLINSISRHFCSSCNRLRLTADGKLKSCLYWQKEFGVHSALGNKAKLKNLIKKALKCKNQRHSMGLDETVCHKDSVPLRSMSRTGG